jgi:hypothetical protein
MGFWKKLFGLEGKKTEKFDPFAVDGDGDGKVQDGTIWERPASLTVDLDKTMEKVEELLKEVAPNQDFEVSEALAKKAAAQARAQKAAATRAANKAKKEAELAKELSEKISRVEKVKADAERMAKEQKPKKK